MIAAEQIPPEVVEAAARAITMALILAVDEDCRACALTDDERAELARAAIAAALAAWPGMFEEYMNNEDGDGASLCVILPQEPSNA